MIQDGFTIDLINVIGSTLNKINVNIEAHR
jgi:hypothetical protein